MTNIMEHERTVPEVFSADVVVCGGGPAGFIAAIAAARQGATVVLLEKNGFLGGMATAGLVGPISNFRCGGELIIGGIPWEFVTEMEEMGGAVTSDPSGNVAFDPEIYKLVAEDMVGSAGLKVFLHTAVVEAVVKGEGELSHIIIETKSGRQAVGCKYVIDCTGDGDLVARAGFACAISEPSKLQPVSLVFHLGGVDTEALEPLYLGVGDEGGFNAILRQKLLEAREQGIDVPLFGGPWVVHGSTIRPGYVSVNATRKVCSCIDVEELTAAQLSLRKDMFRLFEFMRSSLDALQDAYIVYSAATVGTRESRRVRGVYELNEEDILSARPFEDTVCKGSHPIDSHSPLDPKQSLTWLKEAYNIPYRSLVPIGSKNVLVAGRNISATSRALASTRVQATAMALGQAAGTAGALCARYNVFVSQLDTGFLRMALKEQGAII